jgi:hypothetical protein
MASDSEVPPLQLGLHRGIVLEAAIWLLDDTEQDTAKLEKRKQELVNKIPLHVRRTGAGPDYFRPDIRKPAY